MHNQFLWNGLENSLGQPYFKHTQFNHQEFAGDFVNLGPDPDAAETLQAVDRYPGSALGKRPPQGVVTVA